MGRITTGDTTPGNQTARAADKAKAAAAAKTSTASAAQTAARKQAQTTDRLSVTNPKPAAKAAAPAASAAPKPSPTPAGTGSLSGLGIGNSSNLGDLFPGADANQIDTLLASGGYGEALRYKLGLIEADLLRLKNEADGANQRAQVALDQGKLALAQKEEADANAIKVQVNQLTEQQQRFQAQGNYADQLMKLGELPENAYKYAFARYGLTTPQGARPMALPEPDAVKGMLLNPNATGQPAPVSVVAPPPSPMGGLMPDAAQPAPVAPTAAAPAPVTTSSPPPQEGTPSAAAPPPSPSPDQPPQMAQGGVAGAGRDPMVEGLMKHALDMAKQGGALMKHHLAPPSAGQAPGGGGMGALMPQGPPAPYGSGTPGLPGFAGGGLAGVGNYRVVPGDNLSTIAQRAGTTLAQLLALNPQFRANPNLIYPGQTVLLRPPPAAAPAPAPAPAQAAPPAAFPAPVAPPAPAPAPGPSVAPAPVPAAPPAAPPLSQAPPIPSTNPYGMPNENQNLGSYSGPTLTLPPALQRLFAQTGHQESGVPINPPPNWMMPHLGTPSTQSLRSLSPDELANTQGFERDIEGKPIDTFKSDIAQHAEQGAGLEIPHSFARGGIAGLPSGAPQPTPYSSAGLPPYQQEAGIYPGFALGGVAGVPTGTGKGVPLPPPMPQPGTAQVPGVGQVAPGPATFGEAGPEAAVPLDSPGGPLALQALAANQQAQPNLGALMGPTSTDAGPQLSQAILPLTNIPTQRLGPGQRSEAVGKLQQALEQAGYLQMPPSANYGFYGPVTVHAVRRFQQDQGITAGDLGIWNKQSAAALKTMLQGPASAPEGPSPYDMRGAGAPGDLNGPLPGPAAAAGASLPAGGGSGGLGSMMPLGL